MAVFKLLLFLTFIAAISASPAISSNNLNNKIEENRSITNSEISIDDAVRKYILEENINFDLPFFGPVSLGARSLDNEELDLKINYGSGVQEARKKSKIKKVLIPILILVLLKAITFIPLAIGVLGIKTWNALQLSFVTFIISIGMAVYNFCKKLAHDTPHPPIAAHGPWESPSWKRSSEGQDLAYSAYAQQY